MNYESRRRTMRGIRGGVALLALTVGLVSSHGAGLVCRAWAEDGMASAANPPADRLISARGRFEPKDGIVKLAGPSQPTIFINVISELRVKEGDRIGQGQIIAVFDSYASKKAAVQRLQAELAHARRQYERFDKLFRKQVATAEERENWQMQVDVTQAQLQQAQADLDLAVVRAPITGQVIKIHAYPGERVGIDGVAELGQTDQMYAVAEVYENDIGGVRVGQRATVTAPALKGELQGTVEHIGWKVAKMDVLDSDPAAKADARIVEVKIRLDDSARVARLTNMQVDVRIQP